MHYLFGLSIFFEKNFCSINHSLMVNGHFTHNTFYYFQAKEVEFVSSLIYQLNIHTLVYLGKQKEFLIHTHSDMFIYTYILVNEELDVTLSSLLISYPHIYIEAEGSPREILIRPLLALQLSRELRWSCPRTDFEDKYRELTMSTGGDRTPVLCPIRPMAHKLIDSGSVMQLALNFFPYLAFEGNFIV